VRKLWCFRVTVCEGEVWFCRFAGGGGPDDVETDPSVDCRRSKEEETLRKRPMMTERREEPCACSW